MNSIDKLSELFARFPGIGPRQAKRFVYFLLSRDSGYLSEIVKNIENLKNDISQCQSCQRYFPLGLSQGNLCRICLDNTRDKSILMIVPRDIDLESIEKSGIFYGSYFVLGGVIPILDKEPEKQVRLALLDKRLKSDSNIKEVVLAMNVNNDGQHTSDYIREKFKDLKLVFTVLGRGLSTGAELEYSDPETIKNAFIHRTK